MTASSLSPRFRVTCLPDSSVHSSWEFSTKKDFLSSQPETSTRYRLVTGLVIGCSAVKIILSSAVGRGAGTRPSQSHVSATIQVICQPNGIGKLYRRGDTRR